MLDRPAGWETLVEGTTDADGAFAWAAPGEPTRADRARCAGSCRERRRRRWCSTRPRPPDGFADNQWSADAGRPGCSGPSRRSTVAARSREALVPPLHRAPGLPPGGGGPHQGLRAPARPRAARARSRAAASLRRRGPGRPGLALSRWSSRASGSFYQRVRGGGPADRRPIAARFEDCPPSERLRRGRASAWRPTACRASRCACTAPTARRSTATFEVALTATYYAGGRVAGRPVRWRVTQFPYAWTPEARDGLPLLLRRALLAQRAASRPPPALEQAGRHRRRRARAALAAQPRPSSPPPSRAPTSSRPRSPAPTTRP